MAARIAQRCARESWIWLVAFAAATTAVLLLLGGDRLRGALDALTRGTPPEDGGAVLTGSTPAPGSDPGPVLQGAPRQALGQDAPAHGPVTVTVLDRAALPIPGVRVAQGVATSKGLSLQSTCDTDAGGRARFEDVPYDGTADVTVVIQALGAADLLGPPHDERPAVFYVHTGNSLVLHLGDGSTEVSDAPATPTPLVASRNEAASAVPHGGAAHARVTGPEVTLTIHRGLPFEVDVRSADGRPLSARWQVTPRLEWAAHACESPRLAVQASGDAVVRVKVEPPRGMLAAPAEPWNVWVHPQAARLRAVVPLRTEAEVVAVFPPHVLPFREEQWAAEVSVGGRQVREPKVRLGRDGRASIRGVPHLVGETLSIGGMLAERWHVQGAATIGGNPLEPIVMEVHCEPPPRDVLVDGPLEFVFQVTRTHLPQVGACTPRVGGILRLPRFLDAASGVETPVGDLRMRVLTPSGAPARGASVRSLGFGGVTDEDGVLLFTDLPPGPDWLWVGGSGAPERVRIDVKAGETTDVEVRTRAGGTIEVEVVDVLERALPFATLRVQQPCGFPWIDLDGDVQRIDPYTDERGRRTLRTVEPGTVKVHATFGSRAAEADVEVLEGETTRVRLVLPAADAPPKSPEPPPAR